MHEGPTRWWLRILVWLALALAITAPAGLHPWSQLIGDPRIDVWNHVWGYWFVSDALSRLQLPFTTTMIGAPDGGTLYFIDCVGAVLASPLTLLAGPAFAYNVTVITRVAMAGLATQLLSDELTGPGRHGWLAGLAYMSSPFLLCELANGISEVVAVGWLPLTLWTALRATRLRSRASWVLLGLVQGFSSMVSFYYGLATAVLVVLALVVALAPGILRTKRVEASLARGLALAAAIALALAIPHWVLFQATLAAPDALVRRPMGLENMLLEHNAVDPRVYIWPGNFQSVDLLAEYGESFIHTSYLRWSVIILAAWGCWKGGWRLASWLLLAATAMFMGLGNYLWLDGDWVELPGGALVSLPFGWIRAVLPQVAITHPLRLSTGAHAVLAVAAGFGAHRMSALLGARWHRVGFLALAALVVAETLWGSAASWPIPRSSTSIQDIYADVDDGLVLDLPAEVGTSMETSRYFWYQTLHERPIPYTPDARAGSARDRVTFEALQRVEDRVPAHGQVPALPEAAVGHMRRTYAMIVVHQDLERRAGLEGTYRSTLTPAFGEPRELGDKLVWVLSPSSAAP